MKVVYKYAEWIAVDFIERLIQRYIPKFKGLYHTPFHFWFDCYLGKYLGRTYFANDQYKTKSVSWKKSLKDWR